MWSVKHLIWGDSFILWNTVWHSPSRNSMSFHSYPSCSPLRTSRFINFDLAIWSYIELCPPRNNKFWVPEYSWYLLSFVSRVNGLAEWGRAVTLNVWWAKILLRNMELSTGNRYYKSKVHLVYYQSTIMRLPLSSNHLDPYENQVSSQLYTRKTQTLRTA